MGLSTATSEGGGSQVVGYIVISSLKWNRFVSALHRACFSRRPFNGVKTDLIVIVIDAAIVTTARVSVHDVFVSASPMSMTCYPAFQRPQRIFDDTLYSGAEEWCNGDLQCGAAGSHLYTDLVHDHHNILHSLHML